MHDEELNGTERHDSAGLGCFLHGLVEKKQHVLHHRSVAIDTTKPNQFRLFQSNIMISVRARECKRTDSLAQNTFLVLNVTPGASCRAPIGRAAPCCTATG